MFQNVFLRFPKKLFLVPKDPGGGSCCSRSRTVPSQHAVSKSVSSARGWAWSGAADGLTLEQIVALASTAGFDMQAES